MTTLAVTDCIKKKPFKNKTRNVSNLKILISERDIRKFEIVTNVRPTKGTQGDWLARTVPHGLQYATAHY